MELVIQRLVDGTSNGFLYGAVALALVLIHRSTGLVNFAQGEMAMFSTFVVWKLADERLGFGLALAVAISAGLVFAFLLGAALERTVIRPFTGSGPLTLLIVTLGLYLAINSLAGYVFTTDTERLDSPFPSGGVDLGGVTITYMELGTVAVLLVVALLIRQLFMGTKLGLGLRAAAMNPASSRLAGIDVGRMMMIGWGLASAIGALAAILVAPVVYVSTNMMAALLLYGFAAAVVGGFDSPFGALVGGVLVGLIQSLAAGYLPFIGTQLQLATAFAVILLVLLVRPQGLFGRVPVERV
ncbi:branched-chain amino acid ABC transporter permease [Actinomadura vinacea]|uniref:Branched-chain amino acid ABC transporter permease n=1 Tax=Actinomadura vinacea TaxID=115336 RepID=A0ABN3JYE0_9ACTN